MLPRPLRTSLALLSVSLLVAPVAVGAGCSSSGTPVAQPTTTDDAAAPDDALEAAPPQDTAPAGPSGIGDACTADTDCAKGQKCLTFFPGGYCTQACDTSDPCPSDAICRQRHTSSDAGTGDAATASGTCIKSCTSDGDCRVNEGYACDPSSNTCRPTSSGGSSGKGVTPGTNAGAACVQPTVDAPGTGSPFGPDQKLSQRLMAAECDVAADPAHHRVVAAWIDVTQSATQDSFIGVSISDDDGKTWTIQPYLPVDATVDKNGSQSDPVVTVDPDGNFFITWIGFDRSGATAVSNMNVYVAKAAPGGGFTQLSIASPGEWNANAEMDKPWIAASPVDGTLYATWMRATNVADIRLSRSNDHGKTWSTPITVSDSSARPANDRNLAQVAVGADGKVYVVWVEVGAVSTQAQAQAAQFGSTANQVYVQKLDADATKIGTNVLVTRGMDSPPFEDPSIAVAGGNVYVGFISGTSNGAWDVRVSASLDGAQTFADSVKANDDATCATHFHHQLAVDGDGNVHVIYFDNRYLVGNVFHDQSAPATATSPLDFSKVKAAFVNSSSFDFTTDRDTGEWVGDYLGFKITGKTMHALWTDPRASKTAQIYYAQATLP